MIISALTHIADGCCDVERQESLQTVADYYVNVESYCGFVFQRCRSPHRVLWQPHVIATRSQSTLSQPGLSPCLYPCLSLPASLPATMCCEPALRSCVLNAALCVPTSAWTACQHQYLQLYLYNYVYIYTYVYIYIYIYIHTYICIYIYIHTYICIYIYIYIGEQMSPWTSSPWHKYFLYFGFSIFCCLFCILYIGAPWCLY